jgi:2-phosphosulfolactate phosphatase
MSAGSVRVALVPPAPGSLPAESCAVVIDVLRATTTLTVARRNGAVAVVPFASPAAALAFRAAHAGTLACGERDGHIVPGFDMGNSPFEYTREQVAGRTLAFASTNGSRALLAASRCRRRILGCIASLEGTVSALAGERDVWIVCAGKLGRFALEDAVCAGAIVARLAARGVRPANDSARLVLAIAPRDAAEAGALVRAADHGRWLSQLGGTFASDVEFCATPGALDSAAEC